MDGSRLWSDLPQDIVGIIINKLRFHDQIRAVAVCKGWRDCKSFIRSSETLPWLVHHEHGYYVNSVSSLVCELLNPHSQEVYKVPYSKNISPSKLCRELLASKQGWLLFHSSHSQNLLRYNPFTNDRQWVPQKAGNLNIRATINTDPVSHELETFMLANRAGYLCIDIFKAGALTSELIVEMSRLEMIHSVLYMKGIVYCLLYSGKLYSYNLKDKSWKLLTSRLPKPDAATNGGVIKCFLLEIMENLMMDCKALVNEVSELIMTFRFDWSKMSWVVENGLKGCAIYISGNIAFSAPSNNRSCEMLDGCRVFFCGRDIKCYSMSEGKVAKIQCEEYSWIRCSGRPWEWSFIEPPYFGS